jgi:hypothetical protein
MNTTSVILGAIGSVLFSATAFADPPSAEANRESYAYLSAGATRTVGDQFWSMSVSVRDAYNMQGEYKWSYVYVTEWSFSSVTWEGYTRYADCRIDPGALRINANGTAASASAYVANARDQAVCSYAASGIEPFDEILVDFAGSDPAWVVNSQNVGRVINQQVTSQFNCRQSQASGFQIVTLAVNGESLPVSSMDTYVYDCHGVIKQ